MIDISKHAKIRSFIAIDLPSAITEGIRDVQEKLKLSSYAGRIADTKVSWVKPENIHLTLKFLGDVEEKQLGKILCAINEVASFHTTISLSVEGLGCFPNAANPKVVWIGIGTDIEPLLSLHRNIEKSLARIGLKREKRGYHPHLTLGRIRSLTDGNSWKEMLNRFNDVRLGTFEADRIVLFKSDLNPKGAVYTKLGEAGFFKLKVKY